MNQIMNRAFVEEFIKQSNIFSELWTATKSIPKNWKSIKETVDVLNPNGKYVSMGKSLDSATDAASFIKASIPHKDTLSNIFGKVTDDEKAQSIAKIFSSNNINHEEALFKHINTSEDMDWAKNKVFSHLQTLGDPERLRTHVKDFWKGLAIPATGAVGLGVGYKLLKHDDQRQ